MKTLLFFISLLTLTACSSNDDAPKDQLPLATTIGANTAGCLIDGEVLIPKNGIQAIGGSAPYGLTIGAGNEFNAPIIGNDYLYIRIANLKDKGGDVIYLQINDMTNGAGIYNIGQSNGQYYIDGPNNPHVIVITYDGVNLGKVYYSGTNAGTITFTRFDYLSGVYSGTFSATLYNKDNPSERIQITEGRFDIGLGTLNQ